MDDTDLVAEEPLLYEVGPPDEPPVAEEPPEPPPPRRRSVVPAVLFWFVLIAAVATTAWWRLEVLSGLADQGFFAKYTHFAQRIVDGEMPVHRLGDLSPGYLWSVVGLMGSGGLDAFGLRTVQVGMLALVAVLCAVAASRLWGRLAGLVAAAAVLTSRAALLNATELEPETLVLLLNTAALTALVVFRGRTGQTLSGLLFGLSIVTRPTAVVAAGLVVLWVWRMKAAALDGGWRFARSVPVAMTVGIVLPVAALQFAYASIPGVETLMNPGTVFYEGMNPATTGLAGDAPAVVRGVERGIGEPDALHEAYRLVASRALGEEAGRASNLFWWQRARAFATAYPEAAARIVGRKVVLALSSHDAWDLKTTARKEIELETREWAPFGLLLALGLVGACLIRSEPVVGLFVSYLGSYWLVLIVFYVTARQRNPLLPCFALLAGAAVHHLADLLRSRRLGAVFGALVVIAAVTVAAGLPGRAQSEDRHTWDLVFAADYADARAAEAEAAGDSTDARSWRAASSLLCGEPFRRGDAAAGLARVQEVVPSDGEEPARFDVALAMMATARWSDAARALERLDETGYRPLRGVMAVPSVAFYRARCALRAGVEENPDELLDRAALEAPGNAEVLALRAALARRAGADDEAAADEVRLAALHDPFSVGLACAHAAFDLGDQAQARALLDDLCADLPEWPLPLELRRALPTR